MVTLYRPNSLFRDFNRFANQLNKMTLGSNPVVAASAADTLGINWQVEEDQVVVSAEVPGMNPEDFDISLEKGNHLTITGERMTISEEEAENVTFIRRERRVGSFIRKMQLPYHIAENGIEADYSNGILTITLPRAEEDKPRQIVVKSS